jgi:hypothetical protein
MQAIVQNLLGKYFEIFIKNFTPDQVISTFHSKCCVLTKLQTASVCARNWTLVAGNCLRWRQFELSLFSGSGTLTNLGTLVEILLFGFGAASHR